MTVAELKKALEGVDDSLEIILECNHFDYYATGRVDVDTDQGETNVYIWGKI